MEKQILGQEPAFPIEEKDGMGSHWQNHLGMSKRFYAACTAMQVLISVADEYFKDISPEKIAIYAYQYADELLKQENQ